MTRGGGLLGAAALTLALAAGPGALRAAPPVPASAMAEVEATDRALADGALPAAAQAPLLLRRAVAWGRLGYLPRAVDGYRAALAAADAAGDGHLQRQAQLGLGLAQLRLGDFPAAESSLLTAAQAAGDTAALAAAQVGLGVLYAATGRGPAAETALTAALAAADQAGARETAAEAALNGARLALDGGRRRDAGEWLKKAAARVPATPQSGRDVIAAVTLARLSSQAGGKDAALQAHGRLTAAAAAAERLGDQRGLSFAWGYLGALYEQTGQSGEAAALTRRAATAAIAAQAPESLYLWRWQEARLAAAAGALRESAAAYERAAVALDEVRGALGGDALSGGGSFRQTVEPLFMGYAETLLRLADAEPESQQQWLYRARATMERLKAAELEDYFKDDCVAELDARKRAIDRLVPGAAAIYPILLPDRTEILVSIGDRLERFSVPAGRAALTKTINEFRGLLEKRATHQYREPGKKLYDWLIAPLEPRLRAAGVDTLVIVPDGPLRTIPLAALYDGDRFLVERYAVSVSPGLTLIDPKPLASTRPGALLAGLSVAAQGFPALPQVEAELDGVGRILGADSLRNADFSQNALARELRRAAYGVVHIASHGEFSSDHLGSFLLTHDGKISLERLESLVAVSRFREKPVELLVLSACQTAAGDERAALGLAGVALKAGARSAVASLWYVNDAASSELMLGFYQHLQKDGASKAQALRRAQQDLAGQARYRHPYYWAAYMVIGNWL